jgi:hypothetical protein
MSIRPEPGRTATAAIACLFSIAALAAPVLAQPVAQEAPEDDGARAWLGCWELLTGREDRTKASLDGQQLVCVARGDAPSALELKAIVRGLVVASDTLITDGSRQAIDESGCSGWRRTRFSEDRRRLYLQSETTCEDGGERHLSGASMMVSGDHWVDVRVLRVDGEREIAIQDYVRVGDYAVELPGRLPSAAHAAGVTAAAPLTADDVIEALEYVDPAVVEAMLLETGSRFPIDSRLLLRLANAGVPDEIIDVMVALSFPEYFAVEGDTVSRRPAVYYGGYWSPWYPYYGYGFGYHYYHHPPVGGHPEEGFGGKVISGRGYVAVQPTGRPSGGFADEFVQSAGGGGGGFMGSGASGGSSSGTTGSANSSGYQSGDSNSIRPAIPK